MPYPVQVTHESILQTAVKIVEGGDLDALSLGQIAKILGIKPPSLYRYFPSKAALIDALNLDTMSQLTQMQNDTAVADHDAAAVLIALAKHYRAYAHAHPQRYLLAFATVSDDVAVQESLLQLALPLQASVSQLVGEAHSLASLRGLWALIHGFIALELSNKFQRGGDLDDAFDAAILTFLKGLQR